MANPVKKEQAIRLLASLIDRDEPLAAQGLARAVVSLVQDREPREALSLVRQLADLAALPKNRRSPTPDREPDPSL